MPPGDRLKVPLERFAAEMVGLETTLDESATRAALFGKLRDHDFLPDPLQHQAILALAGRPVVGGSVLLEALAEAEGRRLHVEVEEYAADFFGLPVASRVDQYRLLGQACAQHPRLIERLRLLRPGLMIDRASLTDASPLVQRLLDDILDLFPLRPEARAVEARERVARFESDPKSTDAERARALKTLARRHADVVKLLPDYPARLGKARVRRRASPEAVRSRTAGFLALFDQRTVWIIAVCLLPSLGRLLTSMSPTKPPLTPSSFQLPGSVPSPGVDVSRIPVDKARMASAVAGYLRDKLKTSILRELTKIGKPLDDRQLNGIVARLPVEELPPVGDMVTIIQNGHWTEPVRNRFIDCLKVALKTTKLGLTDAEIDKLAPLCFPKASTRGKP
jgi:hypothetical protein